MTDAAAQDDTLLAYYRRRTEHARRLLAGLPSLDNVEAILEEYRALFAPDLVRGAVDTATGDYGADRYRRRALVLLEGAIALRTARELDALDAWECDDTLAVGGVRCSPRDIAARLRGGPGGVEDGERSELAAAYEHAVAHSASLRRDLWVRRAEAARDLGHGSYAELYSALLPLDLAELAAAANMILRETEHDYRAGLAAHRRDALDEALGEGGCIGWFQVPQLFAGHQWDALFARRRVSDEVERLLDWCIGDAPPETRVLVDLAERAGKTTRPFCAAVEVPGRVHLVARPHGTHRDWEELYHELGHIAHFVHAPAELPWEMRHLPWDAVAETHAFWLASLLRNPVHLVASLGLQEAEARRYAAFATFLELFMVRAYCARFLHEQAFHAGGSTAVTSYPARMRDAVAVRYPASWALLELDGGLASAQYLQAWLLWGELRCRLPATDAEAGERMATLRALWRSCATDTPASLIGGFGLPRPNPRRLVKALTVASPAGLDP